MLNIFEFACVSIETKSLFVQYIFKKIISILTSKNKFKEQKKKTFNHQQNPLGLHHSLRLRNFLLRLLKTVSAYNQRDNRVYGMDYVFLCSWPLSSFIIFRMIMLLRTKILKPLKAPKRNRRKLKKA